MLRTRVRRGHDQGQGVDESILPAQATHKTLALAKLHKALIKLSLPFREADGLCQRFRREERWNQRCGLSIIQASPRQTGVPLRSSISPSASSQSRARPLPLREGAPSGPCKSSSGTCHRWYGTSRFRTSSWSRKADTSGLMVASWSWASVRKTLMTAVVFQRAG